MQLSFMDRGMLAVTIWRENRGGGRTGMQSVVNVILNTCEKRGHSVYAECTAPERYSSVTVHSDPETTLYGAESDASWQLAMSLAGDAENLEDITGGATLYYAPAGIAHEKKITLPDGSEEWFPPGWDPARVQFTARIASQIFFREI